MIEVVGKDDHKREIVSDRLLRAYAVVRYRKDGSRHRIKFLSKHPAKALAKAFELQVKHRDWRIEIVRMGEFADEKAWPVQGMAKNLPKGYAGGKYLFLVGQRHCGYFRYFYGTHNACEFRRYLADAIDRGRLEPQLMAVRLFKLVKPLNLRELYELMRRPSQCRFYRFNDVEPVDSGCEDE